MTPVDTLIITPYLNTRAFVHHGPAPGCRLATLAPRLAVPAIIHGDALAAIVPVAALGLVAAHADLLGDFGIACPGAAQSVLLFSRVPFAAIDTTTRVMLSADSMSSVRLLFLLLRARPGPLRLPQVVEPGSASDAELVIGDAALRRQAGRHAPNDYPHGYAHVLDLAAAWRARHGLPMVFARWVVQNDTPPARRAELLGWLAAFAADQERLYALTAARDHARAGLTADDALAYLQGIRIALGAEDLAGQRRYEDELSRCPWPPELALPTPVRPIYQEVSA